MTHQGHIIPDGGSSAFIQIIVPPSEEPVPPVFPVGGQYGGTGSSPVLINVALGYANPAQPGQATGLRPPEEPGTQMYNRLLQNATPTIPGQVGLLTAFLYDITGTILLAQSLTIEITINPG